MEDKIKKYYFKVTLCGCGDTAEEAWSDAVEGFMLEPGVTPEKEEYAVTEEDL